MAMKIAKKEVAAVVEEPKSRKKPERKPMTEVQKAAAAKQRKALKKAAENMKPEDGTAYYVINESDSGKIEL